MIAFEPNLFFDESVCKLFDKRQYNKSFKKALNFAMKKWHKTILKTHFTRTAYGKYRSQYFNKKSKGRPMVKTGQLSRSVLSNINIRGTSKKVTGKVFFGTPKQMSSTQKRKQTFRIMAFKKVSYKIASKEVAKSLGNYAKNRDLFVNQINAMNKGDLQRIHGWVKEFMLEELKSTGKKRKITKITKSGCK